ncbi:hypothetical protein SCRM01_224 [Synechococcus phage S-CRM01]|uniref:hypothetical protein n=1 Tax=Synechococcus phage S-CRM01 TaxID=1026955 RepID=UPI000209E431|nr:hypothetical protein SCRM01_224 [Synechococcus phage S-CRM01]AEC53170.1 hypothetical protein SCRM01_224 [Synechococcus phage S-CRM01]
MTILAKFQCDWADEHDVYGLKVYDSREELEKVFTYMTAYWEEYPGKEVELGFGTNEYLTFDSIKSFRECFTILDISNVEFETLKKFFACRWNEDRVEFGYTGWDKIIDQEIPYGDDDKNERLDILAKKLWPPRKF